VVRAIYKAYLGNRHSITGLSYVDFWVENDEGIETVSKDAERYELQ